MPISRRKPPVKRPKRPPRRNAKKKATKKTAKRKTSKKKASKKRAKKKGKNGKLKRVPKKDYEIVWDKRYQACHFGTRKGVGGEIGSGVNDVIEVYTDGQFYYVLSMNYTEGYACVEAFDDQAGGCAALCFALPEDLDEIVGKPLEEADPSEVLEAMTQVMETEG